MSIADGPHNLRGWPYVIYEGTIKPIPTREKNQSCPRRKMRLAEKSMVYPVIDLGCAKTIRQLGCESKKSRNPGQIVCGSGPGSTIGSTP